MRQFWPGGALDCVGRLVASAALTLVLSACTISDFNSGRRVSPAEPFTGPYLDFSAPNSKGWHLNAGQTNKWVFAKVGSEADETYIASITKFALPSAISHDDFIARIKKEAELLENPNRFNNVRSRLEFSDAREYPCIRYRATSDDTQPNIKSEDTRSYLLDIRGLSTSIDGRSLVFEMDALYCNNPLLTNEGFAASYSHRGPRADPQFENDAAEFIKGIQVPGH